MLACQTLSGADDHLDTQLGACLSEPDQYKEGTLAPLLKEMAADPSQSLEPKLLLSCQLVGRITDDQLGPWGCQPGLRERAEPDVRHCMACAISAGLLQVLMELMELQLQCVCPRQDTAVICTAMHHPFQGPTMIHVESPVSFARDQTRAEDPFSLLRLQKAGATE